MSLAVWSDVQCRSLRGMNGALQDPLVGRVLDRLGLTPPPVTREGLAAVYRAWCEQVPWDNVQKRITVVDRRAVLGGAEPSEFFENFLRDGTGGTCWPSAGALHALLSHLGFPARRGIAAMGEERWGRQQNHGTTIVSLDDESIVVDTSILHLVPLPLRDGASTEDPAHRARVVRHNGEWLIWWTLHSRDEEMSCAILDEDVPLARFHERYEASRESGFSHSLTLTKGMAGGILSLNRSQRSFRSADGSVVSTDVADRHVTLVEELGLSEDVVRRLPADEPELRAGSGV